MNAHSFAHVTWHQKLGALFLLLRNLTTIKHVLHSINFIASFSCPWAKLCQFSWKIESSARICLNNQDVLPSVTLHLRIGYMNYYTWRNSWLWNKNVLAQRRFSHWGRIREWRMSISPWILLRWISSHDLEPRNSGWWKTVVWREEPWPRHCVYPDIPGG